MNRYVNGPDREQLFYDMVDIDRLVPEDHEVRRLWAFLGHLNLERVYSGYKAIEEEFGRRPMEPKVLFAVWLYGFTKGIVSSEELSKLCNVHNEFRWICGGLKPCARTLRNFRNANREELEELLIESIAALMEAKLINVETVSQDGTTIRSCSSKKSFKKRDGIERVRDKAEERVKELMSMSEEEASEYSKRQLSALRREAEKRLKLAEEALAKLEERKEKAEEPEEVKVSTSEPDSRFMKCKEGMKAPAYNVQIVSSGDSDPAVLGVDVYEEAEDRYTLEEMSLEVSSRVEGIRHYLTDKGYHCGVNAHKMVDLGIEWYCNIPKNQLELYQRSDGKDEYKKGDFRYEQERDVYICPEGRELSRVGRRRDRKAVATVYRCKECNGCRSRKRCTESKSGRHIQRSEHEDELRELFERSTSEEGKEFLKLRGSTSEKMNADIKERFKLRRMYVKGRDAVRGMLMIVGIAINALIWMKHVI